MAKKSKPWAPDTLAKLAQQKEQLEKLKLQYEQVINKIADKTDDSKALAPSKYYFYQLDKELGNSTIKFFDPFNSKMIYLYENMLTSNTTHVWEPKKSVRGVLEERIPGMATKVTCPAGCADKEQSHPKPLVTAKTDAFGNVTHEISWMSDAQKPEYWVMSEPTQIANTIIHLNDDHRWTREQIADWLDTLDVDLRFQTPEDTQPEGES